MWTNTVTLFFSFIYLFISIRLLLFLRKRIFTPDKIENARRGNTKIGPSRSQSFCTAEKDADPSYTLSVRIFNGFRIFFVICFFFLNPTLGADLITDEKVRENKMTRNVFSRVSRTRNAPLAHRESLGIMNAHIIAIKVIFVQSFIRLIP